MKKEIREKVEMRVIIEAPRFKTGVFHVLGTAPLVMNKFSNKVREEMKAKQEAGSQAKKGKKREAKDFEACYEDAIHRSAEGWIGIPASAFRNAMISACRLIGFKMTICKMAVFIIADGLDADEGTPLVKIIGAPHPFDMGVRTTTGVIDVRRRPMFDEWRCELRVRYDLDIFSDEDVANLLFRAGMQVGVGEGRADSKMSAGMGWGFFTIKGKE
jgi:hypothetical protein